MTCNARRRYYPGDSEYKGGGDYYAINHEIDIELPGRPGPANVDIACHACGGSADCPATSYCRGNGVCQGFPDYSSFDPRGECCARP